MKDGVIADFRHTEKMLSYFIQKSHNRKVLVHPRIVIGVPSEITPVENRAVIDSAYRAHASEVHLVEQAMVAAIGAGLPINGTVGQYGRRHRWRHHRRSCYFHVGDCLFTLCPCRRQRDG